MQFLSDVIKWIIAALSAFVGFCFGEWNGLAFALVFMIIADYLSGIIVGVMTKTLSSKVGAKGIAKKIVILLIVMIANIIDVNVIKTGGILRTATIIFYIANEGISILENAARLNIKLPDKLIKVLVQLKETSNDSDSKEQAKESEDPTKVDKDILVEINERE